MPKFINNIIRLMITSDFFLNLGWGLLGPIFAIFIVQRIAVEGPMEAARVAGLSAFCYWTTRSLLQIPIGRYLDKNHGEKDDFWFMVTGTFIAGLIPIGYLFSFEPWHIYFLQITYAIGMSMVIPSWLAIFTRHIDKGKEALEWSMKSTFLGAGAGIAGGLGGIIASNFGFNVIFIFVSSFTFLSVFLLFFIKKDLYAKVKEEKTVLAVKPTIEP